MKSKTLLTILAIGVVAALPVHAAAPFGYLDGIVDGGNAGSGVVPLTGWALDDNGVRSVDILVDGVPAGRALYGTNRPGVTRSYPGYPDSDAAGFAFQLNTTRYLNGTHSVDAMVTSNTGERRFLDSVDLEFLNSSHLLAPFGEIEFPRPAAELFGTCNLAETHRRQVAVTGWALDAGVETGDMGVGYVELLIDGSIVANSRVDCRSDGLFDDVGPTDCYGLRRLDIERTFPTLRNAPQAGYRFVLDPGVLIAALDFAEGQHVLSVRVGDIAGQVAEIDEIPVTFHCDETLGNEKSLGWIAPVHTGNLADGLTQISGWALDWEGVNRVLGYIDGLEVGQAQLGFPTPQLAQRYPGYANGAHAGWRLTIDTAQLSDGRHGVQMVAIDDTGASTLLGEREFVVDNVP